MYMNLLNRQHCDNIIYSIRQQVTTAFISILRWPCMGGSSGRVGRRDFNHRVLRLRAAWSTCDPMVVLRTGELPTDPSQAVIQPDS